MELKGGQQIAASVEKVWAGLFDPEVLQQCLPGCESVTRESEYAYASKLALKIGPVSARFAGRVEMQDVEAPQRCRLVFQGTGGTAGFARGEAHVMLISRDGGTYLEYDATINVGGKLAQIGARLIDTTAIKLASQFFDRFRAVFELEGTEQAEGGHVVSPSVSEAASASVGGTAGGSAAAGTASIGGTIPLVASPAFASQASSQVESPSWLAQFCRARAVWFVAGVGLSSAITHEWLDERAGWFILGAALSYLVTRIGIGKDI